MGFPLLGEGGDDGALFFSQVLVPRGSVRLQPCAVLSAEPCTEDASCECLVNHGLWHGGPSSLTSSLFFFFFRDIAAVEVACVGVHFCACACVWLLCELPALYIPWTGIKQCAMNFYTPKPFFVFLLDCETGQLARWQR